MNDAELDRTIRDGVTALIDQARDPADFPATRIADADDVADRHGSEGGLVGPAGDRSRSRHSPRGGWMSAAALLLVLVVGVGLWLTRDDAALIDAVQDPPTQGRPIDATPDLTTDDLPTQPDDEATWQVLDGPTTGRTFPVLEWAGAQLVVWGGETVSEFEWTDTGATYDPATESWSEMSQGPLSPRSESSAVWTGTELFICCGRNPDADDQTGAAAYDPVDDSWRELPPAPTTVAFGTAVWTGSQVLVIGPGQVGYPDSPTVAMTFDPAADTWRQLDAPPATLGLEPSVSWIGDRAVVWSRGNGGGSIGFELDIAEGRWDALPPVPDELSIDAPSMVATPSEVMLWGPPTDAPNESAGAILDRGSGTWRAMSDDPLGVGDVWNGVVGSQVAVWSGREMVVWTGAVAAEQPQSDTRVLAYDPADDTWRELDRAPFTAHAPQVASSDAALVVGTGAPILLPRVSGP